MKWIAARRGVACYAGDNSEGPTLSQGVVIALFNQAIILIIVLSAPIILTALLVGFTVSILQAITQVQEQTLSFVPKSIAVYSMIMILGPWLMNTLMQFITYVFTNIPKFLVQ